MPNPKVSFEYALSNLLVKYASTDRNTLILAMELQITALKEEVDDEG